MKPKYKIEDWNFCFTGLSIAGGKGAASSHIFVIALKPGGPAESDGQIQPGDEILEVCLEIDHGISIN